MQILRLLAALLVLSGLDLGGTIALKEAAVRKSPGLALLGVALFVALAVAVFLTLHLAALTIVSLGWVVAVQVAVMVVDARAYDVVPGRVQGVAIAVAMLALVVAALAPSKRPPTPPEEPPAIAKIPGQRDGYTSLIERLEQQRRERNPFFDLR